MATHSSTLAWRIPGTEEPSGLLSMGSPSRTRLKRLSSSSSTQMVRNLPAVQETWVQSLGQENLLEKEMATHSSIHGEFHGQRSLAGFSPCGSKELEMTE